MNPITPQGNTSQEAARAKELADLVHKTKLGTHTDHAKEIADKAQQTTSPRQFDTQLGSRSASPKPQTAQTPPPQTTANTVPQAATAQQPNSLAQAASLILKQAKLTSPEKPAPLPRLSQPIPLAQDPLDVVPKPLERINENNTLASQSAVLHTLTQDVESLVKDRKISMVRAVAIESDASPRLAQIDQKDSSSRSLLPLFTAVCIFLSLGIIGMIWYIRNTQTSTETAHVRARYDTGLIFFEHAQPYNVSDLDSYELLGGLAHLRDTVPSSLGSFTVIDMYTTPFNPATERSETVPLSLADFFIAARIPAPPQLTTTLTGEYMFLIHQGDTSRPVILMRTQEPDAAFAGLLVWEKTLAQNLSPFFTLGTLALTSEQPQFKDVSFNNIDARALYDGNGTLLIMYALLERTVIAITNSQNTMSELANRLHTQRLKK